MSEHESIPSTLPDPEFARHLEWQLRTALRRGERFAEPVATRSTVARALRIAVALFVALAIGAGGVLAAQEIRRSSSADLLSAQYHVRVEIARLRVATVQEAFDQVKSLREQGMVAAAELEEAEARRLDAELEARSLELDAFEVGVTGREPDRRISAPIVGGRDLVDERRRLELPALESKLSAASRRIQQLKEMRAHGLVPSSEVADAERSFQELETSLAQLRNERDLRARFLRGELPAERVELLQMREQAIARLAEAQRQFERAAARANETGALADAKAVSDREARDALHELTTREAELRLARLELQAIEARL